MTGPAGGFSHVAARAHEPLRTFHPRRSVLGPERQDALARLWPRWGFSVHDDAQGAMPRRAHDVLGEVLDLERLFGRRAPVVLEIGSGMGEATVAMAAADPDRDWLAVEAHLPGLAQLLVRVERAGLSNVRVAHGDALDLVRRRLPEESLDAVHAFFPDPWPKPRHHKRRLVQPEHVALLRSRLVRGGTLHVATDWTEYAEAMLVVLAADPGLENTVDGFVVPRPPQRPETKFERRGLDLGHEVRDLVFRRRA
ncbi:tRNA (guanosine(46)-N7)-methyltransferase TrmB [Cellulomonas endophytica]|uniref:tRNA (guanosine(46)-N7)-methyltransferase TrmB n=1 Tax=Cellulomonas endophytica TaxID=2494735 RepID=UPI0010127BAC|nr:tRNA (guanosine(46)-N7)-methyltransferase TrmB [Cellulomonas endophytica]